LIIFFEPMARRGRRRRRRQQGRTDAVLVKQTEKVGNVVQVQGAVVAKHIGFTVELRATVDKRCDADEVEIAAEIVVVENRAVLHAAKRMYRVGWCNFCRWSHITPKCRQRGDDKHH
jgi:hypothetical protein